MKQSESHPTWYNLMSDQYSGINDIVVPGTLKDSLVILAVVLEQQTDQIPYKIMTDTGAYSDVISGFFRVLRGHRRGQILAHRPKVPAHKDWRFIKLQEVDYKSEKMKFFKSGLNLIS